MATITVFDRLVDLVLAALAGMSPAPAVIGEEIDLGSLGEGTTSAVSITWLGSTPADSVIFEGQPIDFTTSIQVECWARGDRRSAGSSRPSRALAVQVFQRLWADEGLRVAGMQVQMPAFDASLDMSGISRMGAVTATYEITHRTTLADMALVQ